MRFDPTTARLTERWRSLMYGPKQQGLSDSQKATDQWRAELAHPRLALDEQRYGESAQLTGRRARRCGGRADDSRLEIGD